MNTSINIEKWLDSHDLVSLEEMETYSEVQADKLKISFRKSIMVTLYTNGVLRKELHNAMDMRLVKYRDLKYGTDKAIKVKIKLDSELKDLKTELELLLKELSYT